MPISALRLNVIADTHSENSDITVGDAFKNSFFIIDVVAFEVITALMIIRSQSEHALKNLVSAYLERPMKGVRT